MHGSIPPSCLQAILGSFPNLVRPRGASVSIKTWLAPASGVRCLTCYSPHGRTTCYQPTLAVCWGELITGLVDFGGAVKVAWPAPAGATPFTFEYAFPFLLVFVSVSSMRFFPIRDSRSKLSAGGLPVTATMIL